MKPFHGLLTVALVIALYGAAHAQDDGKKEVLHARAILEAAAEDYFKEVKPYQPGLHNIQNIVQGLREWTESEKRGQRLLVEYRKRRNELRVAAGVVNIPETTPHLSERQKLGLGAVAALTARANEPLFELLRRMVEVDAAKAEKKNE